MTKNFHVGQKIKLTGEIRIIYKDGSCVVDFSENGLESTGLSLYTLSHAEIIEEPVTKKPSEILKEIYNGKAYRMGAGLGTLVEAIGEYLDSQAEK